MLKFILPPEPENFDAKARNISMHYDVEEFEEDIKTLQATGWL